MSLRIRLVRWLICAGLAAVPAAAAEAQQVCYAYDSLGRLTGVIDQSNNAALYEYDAVGNITAIRRKSPTGPVTIYGVDLQGAAPGDRFEIFGVGFSATPSQNQVTIGGVAAPVVSTLPCTLVVEVPASAVSGEIRVITPAGESTADVEFSVLRFDIEGTGVAILRGTTMQFSVVSNGCGDPAVVWYVNGLPGGNTTVGTISPTGIYTAPSVIPSPALAIIRAESVACPNLFAERTLAIVAEFTMYVFDAASVAYGSPPISFPPNVVTHSASAGFGTPPPSFPAGAVLDDASAANVPVITGLSPSSRARGASFTLTVTGANFTGATGLTFLGASTPDSLVTVTNVTVNADGTSMMATVSIAATAVTGTRVVRIDRPGGNSTAAPTSANVFTITQ